VQTPSRQADLKGFRSPGPSQRVPPIFPIVTKHSKAETSNVVFVVGEDRDRDRFRSKRRSRPADTCRVCGKQLTPALKDVEGADGPVRVSCRGLPYLRCPESHETRGRYPDFETDLLDGVYDAIPKSKSRMHARRISFECADCHAPLDVSALALAQFSFELRLGGETVSVTLAMPSARCRRCGKEQAPAHRSKVLGVADERVSSALTDVLYSAGIVQRPPVPEFQASPYASAAGIVLISLILVVGFLIVLSLVPDVVKSSPLFWVAVVGWALIAFPFIPPDEIPGVRPPRNAGIVGLTVFWAAFLLFMAAVIVKDRFPIALVGFSTAGSLCAAAAWFIYSYLWTGKISTCPECGTWRWFLQHERAWFCNRCGLPLPAQALKDIQSKAKGQERVRQPQLRRFLVRFAFGPLWLFVGLVGIGVVALLGYPSRVTELALLTLLWGLIGTIAVAIAAYRQHIRSSRLPHV